MRGYNITYRCGHHSRALGADDGSDWEHVIGGALLRNCDTCHRERRERRGYIVTEADVKSVDGMFTRGDVVIPCAIVVAFVLCAVGVVLLARFYGWSL